MHEKSYASVSTELILMAVSTAVAISGILLARHFYVTNPGLPQRVAEQAKGAYKLLWNKWYLDHIYEGAIVNPLQKVSRAFLFRVVDQGVIDGAINGSGRVTGDMARGLRRLQTGSIPSYLALFVLGTLVVVGWLIWR